MIMLHDIWLVFMMLLSQIDIIQCIYRISSRSIAFFFSIINYSVICASKITYTEKVVVPCLLSCPLSHPLHRKHVSSWLKILTKRISSDCPKNGQGISNLNCANEDPSSTMGRD